MEVELKLRFANCVLCDVSFCPVSVATGDERLLYVFCKYFDLSPNEVESLYDEQIGFPFCDSCRGEKLCTLKDLHDKFTAIEKDISQLVTSVSLEIVHIVNRNKQDHENNEDEENTQSFSTQILCDIRKNISARYKPDVVLIDFRRLFKKRKHKSTSNNNNNHDNNLLCQKYLEGEQNDCNSDDAKYEASFTQDDYNDQHINYPSSTSAYQPPPRKRRKQELCLNSEFQPFENSLNRTEETPRIIYVQDFKKVKTPNSNKITKTKPKKPLPPKVQGKNEGVQNKKRQTITKFKEDESDYVRESEEDEEEAEENEQNSDFELAAEERMTTVLQIQTILHLQSLKKQQNQERKLSEQENLQKMFIVYSMTRG